MAEPEDHRRAANVLDDVAAQRRLLVVTAQEGWRGPHRDAFDDEDAALRRRAETLANELRTAAAALDVERQCRLR